MWKEEWMHAQPYKIDFNNTCLLLQRLENLSMKILYTSLIAVISLLLTEMCHWFPPTESQILKHSHNIQFVGGKRTKKNQNKYLPSKVLKHRWYLSFFSPVTWIDAHWTAGVISNYMKLCGVGLLSHYTAGPAVIKGWTPYRMNNQCSL